QRLLASPAALHVPVEAIVGRIALGAHEPAAVLAGIGVEHLVPGLEPIDLARGHAPEDLRVLLPGGVNLVIAARHASPSRVARRGSAGSSIGILPSVRSNARLLW